MSDLETLMWRLEHQSGQGSAIAVVATFERAPAAGAAERRIEEVSRRLPRLRDRVAPPLLPALPPRWEPDPAFDLAHHVRRVRSARGGDLDDLFALGGPIVAAPFPPDRPPWQMTFVGGLAGGREGLVATFHHSYMDGVGAVQLAANLFDFEPTPAPGPPPPPAPPVGGEPSLLGRLAGDLGAEAARTATLFQGVATWTASSIRDAVRHPEGRAAATAGLLRSALDVGYRLGRPGSDALSGRSEGLWLGALDYPLAAFRRAGRAAATARTPRGVAPEFGCTVNDVFVAAVVGGLGRYHDKVGDPTRTVRVGIPVSTRPDEGGDELGNWLRALAVRAPLDLVDPAVRIRVIHKMIRRAAGEPVTTLADIATAVAVRLPGAARVANRVVGSFEVLASNVPGSPVPMYLGAARVERLIPFGPRGGAALNLTVLSHDGTMHIGVNLDPAAAPAADLMMECLRAGFEETLAVG